jgi:hypothetical protein
MSQLYPAHNGALCVIGNFGVAKPEWARGSAIELGVYLAKSPARRGSSSTGTPACVVFCSTADPACVVCCTPACVLFCVTARSGCATSSRCPRTGARNNTFGQGPKQPPSNKDGSAFRMPMRQFTAVENQGLWLHTSQCSTGTPACVVCCSQCVVLMTRVVRCFPACFFCSQRQCAVLLQHSQEWLCYFASGFSQPYPRHLIGTRRP